MFSMTEPRGYQLRSEQSLEYEDGEGTCVQPPPAVSRGNVF